jgi:hypothetical protein
MANERDRNFTPGTGLNNLGSTSTDTGAGATELGSGSLGAGRGSPGSSGTGGAGDWGAATGGTASSSPDLGDRAEDVAHRITDAADDLRHRAADEVQARVEGQKERAAESLEGVARSLRSASEQMSDEMGIGRYMARAAEQVDNLASFLNNREVTDLMHDVEDFARRQPAAFVGSAFALGLLGARFLKSSRDNVGYGPGGTSFDGSGRSTMHRPIGSEWGSQDPTARVDDPTRDAVSRPRAPGYAPPTERGESGGFRAGGSETGGLHG